MITGKAKAWIDVVLMGNYVFANDNCHGDSSSVLSRNALT
jgi:hypothetical protein